MSSNQSVSTIINLFRAGPNEQRIREEVLPLFVHGSNLFGKYHGDIKGAFTSAFEAGGADKEEALVRWSGITQIIQKNLSNGALNLKSLESELLNFYKAFIKPERTEINQTARTDRCFTTVAPYIVGNTVLDFGCGKGLLGAKIQNKLNKSVYLVDNIDFNKSSLPLYLSDSEGRSGLPDLIADTSIAYLVLHHMDNPLFGLRELARVTKSRLILMEGYVEVPECRFINQTIDWFFNRILLGVDMNVPLNFFKKDQWALLLNEVGFKIIDTKYVGADEKLAPEHHFLMIAERE